MGRAYRKPNHLGLFVQLNGLLGNPAPIPVPSAEVISRPKSPPAIVGDLTLPDTAQICLQVQASAGKLNKIGVEFGWTISQ